MTKKITDFFALEGNYPDLDAEGAVARLSQAIQCRTINYADHSLTDYSEFDKLHAHMKASYPHVMRAGVFERLGHHAVLITIPGSDETLRPCLYTSHQDVVPVVEGTEQDWTYPAFSGAVADSYIWGRGTLDIKEQVFGVLEAAEYLLARGRTFRRTAYLAFGDDEETLNTGALAISDHLKAQGVTLEFVLDEGGGKIESGAAFGAPDLSDGEGLRRSGADGPLHRRALEPPLRRHLARPSRLCHRGHRPQPLPRAAQSRHDGRV